MLFRSSFTIYPFGDILAILSAICWAVYTLILRKIGTKYSEFLISRRLFLYGMITIFPLFIYTFPESGIENITQREFFIPILYLGIIASGVCIWLWNKSITEIGLISTNNYLYLLPVISVVTSNILLHEEISKYIIIGTLLILIGIYCVRTKDYKKYESINY